MKKVTKTTQYLNSSALIEVGKMKLLSKKPFSLLEVIIALTLVSFCALPLIYPHVAMLKAQYVFTRRMQLDHAVNLLYATVLEKLYLNKISWSDLTQTKFEITDQLIQEAHLEGLLTYPGNFTFTEINRRPLKLGDHNYFDFLLTFTFTSPELKHLNKKQVETSSLEYTYHVFITRDLTGTSLLTPAAGNPS